MRWAGSHCCARMVACPCSRGGGRSGGDGRQQVGDPLPTPAFTLSSPAACVCPQGKVRPWDVPTAKTIRDFDDALTIHSFGWNSVDEYYAGGWGSRVARMTGWCASWGRCSCLGSPWGLNLSLTYPWLCCTHIFTQAPPPPCSPPQRTCLTNTNLYSPTPHVVLPSLRRLFFLPVQMVSMHML